MDKLYAFYVTDNYGELGEGAYLGSYFTVGGYELLNKKSFTFKDFENSKIELSTTNLKRLKSLKPGFMIKLRSLSGTTLKSLVIKCLNENDILYFEKINELNNLISYNENQIDLAKEQLSQNQLYQTILSCEKNILKLKKEIKELKQKVHF